ncbi:retrovirus-related pol polyprotein from transposon TNT 1-94 [Tanacetum coccineum]
MFLQKAQLQNKNIAICELKKLIEKCKGKSVETKFDKPSVVRQPNAQRILKPSVLGKLAPFLDSFERKHFSKTKLVPKNNVSEGLSKTVTAQNLPQIARQVIVQLILFIVDSGRIKHMTGNLSLLCNFVEKYLGTVHFGNDQFAPILSYGDLVQGNIMINRVYYVEGLNHNLFSVGQFYDADLEYVKDQLCSSCEVSKAKRSSFKTKAVPCLKGRLNLLHMDLCGPMRVASINGKKYILVIIDDYSRYTWTFFLRSKDETPEVLKDFLTMIQRNLQVLVISVRTDRGTEFLNKTLHAFFKEEGIEHQTSTPRTPKQNSIVERRNRTLVEAARTMLSASKLPLDDENLDNMKEKGDPYILMGYSTHSKGYRVYNKSARLIVESIHLRFDEIKEMTETSIANDTLGLIPQRQKASDYDNSDPVSQLQNVSPSADIIVPSQQELDLLSGPLYDEFFNAGTFRVNKSSSPTDNSTQQDTHPLTNIHPTSEPSNPTNVHAEENNNNQAEDAQF